ncbi:MurR/RpiR family transcriptional regulator [Lactobacillus porci]|uniref:MurR/RpiR family transcriptional regulator n=1 Tax=Lactobacillus porci TaxID=2012477 RepID=UPI0039954C91
MENEESIIEQILCRKNGMSPSDQKVAQIVLNKPKEVVNYTISQLAQAAGVSGASVTRFCHNLNLSGFHQLKVSLARVKSPVSSLASLNQDDVSQALDQIAASKEDEIDRTIRRLPAATLKEVLDLLENSRLIQVAAEGDTYPVAEDAVYKLNQLGLLAISSPTMETVIGQAMNMSNSDCLWLISNSGESSGLLKLADLAKEKGIKVVAMTNRPDSPLVAKSDYHLTTAIGQTVLQEEYLFSRLASSSLVEAIFLLLLNRDKKRLSHIQAHEKLIADRKV